MNTNREKDLPTVAIVGCGNMGRRHAACVQSNPGLRLLGGVETSPENGRVFSEQFQRPTWPSLADALALGPDLVVICTPNAYHAEAAIAALRAGAAVLCEKPAATTVADARRMAEAEAAGAHRRFAPRHRLFLGMHYRFAVEQLSRQLTPDAFGRPVTGTARWMRDRFVPASPTFIDPQHSGGGVLFDLGVHLFDTVWVLAGRPEPTWVDAVVSNEVARATAVHGWGDYRRDAMNVDGHAKLSLRFDGGSGPDLLVDLEAAFAVNWPGPDGGSAGAARPRELASIELSGTLAGVALGLAVSDAPPASPRLVRERDGMLVEESLPGLPPPPRCYELQMEHYRRALLGEEEPMTGPDDAVRQMRVVAAAVRSAQTRRPIEITSI